MERLTHIKVPAHADQLNDVWASVGGSARAQEFSDERLPDVRLMTEEVFVNICSYAYAEKKGTVEINTFVDGGIFIIEFIDDGVSFDMTAAKDPDLLVDIKDRKVGGLGIFLIKKIVSDINYCREKNKNILKLSIQK